VRAHRDLGALASDILLYDRLVLPVPADDAELERWEKQDWDPDLIALRAVQGGELVYTVPWTAELRSEHGEQMGLQRLSGEIGYGFTANLLTTSPKAWTEIMKGLDPDQVPERRPFLIAAYQSEVEARAALSLGTATHAGHVPGERPEDRVVASKIRTMLEEPVAADPEEAWWMALQLASTPEFIAARRALFNYVDNRVVDQTDMEEFAQTIAGLEGAYNQAVKDFQKTTRRKRVVTLLPRAIGAGAGLLGVPGGSSAGSALSTITGRFMKAAPDPTGRAGAAFSMIRASYRDKVREAAW
jgi:hypothetical protein